MSIIKCSLFPGLLIRASKRVTKTVSEVLGTVGRWSMLCGCCVECNVKSGRFVGAICCFSIELVCIRFLESSGILLIDSVHVSKDTFSDFLAISFINPISVANLRRHLAAAIPTSDQILLLGPPYKVPKDSTFQSEEVLSSLQQGDGEDSNPLLLTTESTGARRLFLFSKQALSEHARDPDPCHLQPMALTLPTQPGPSPLQLTTHSPLHQALEVYERRFMLHLDQGRVLADGADMRLAACRQCVQEQAIMARALRAAVSNLSVHFNGTQRLRSEFTAEFQQKTTQHSMLLQRFEHLLTTLSGISLHPTLVSVARASGRVMETLLDTVPVEKERAWAVQCQTSHQRLLTMFAELESAFTTLGTTSSREEEARHDLESEKATQELWKEVQANTVRDQQAQRLGELTSNHGEVVKVIMNAVNGNDPQSAFTALEEIANKSSDVLPLMQADDEILRKLMLKVADAKTKCMKRMKVRLREVSVAQSAIQRVNSSVNVLREALNQQCENMIHLEHVSELPKSYKDFEAELRRRRAYGDAATSSWSAMMEKLASMRSDEVKAREKFLRGSGRHLMPPFYEIFAPTLATPPPLFTPQMPAMVELETLPELGPTDSAAIGSSSASPMQGGVSSASSLTAGTHHSRHEEEHMATENQPQDQLIVSADDQTDNEIIAGSTDNAAADAERKTLAYENAVLRQAIERMGLKSPRTYIDEAKDTDPKSSEIANLRKKLAEARAESEKAQEALREQDDVVKKSDKISYKSFAIHDIALFMPTGRSSGGKQHYLAFHSNCPNNYLSPDCVRGRPDFVLGRIVYQEQLKAGEQGTDANPFHLPVGTTFFVNTVEVLNKKA